MAERKTKKVIKKISIFFLFCFVFCITVVFWARAAHAPDSAQKTSQIGDNTEDIPVVIVPHFDDFAKQRAEEISSVAGKYHPATIIVVSVNHYNSGSANIITAKRTWTLAGGNVSSDSDLVGKLLQSNLATEDDSAFSNEHGITNVLPDIRDNYTAKIVPIIIRDTTPKTEIDKLADWLNENYSNSLLVASVDFSHYQPNNLAQIHDQYSIQSLSNLDTDKIWQAETDSPQTLYLAEKIAISKNCKNFHLTFNSNSGAANQNNDVETTSVVTGYYSDAKAESVPAQATTFMFAGDAMFDRTVWTTFSQAGLKTIFDNFGTRSFHGVDLPVLNLEGPISATRVSPASVDSLVFNFQPEVSDVLKYINVGAVSLANNHTSNAGSSGFKTTQNLLTEAGIKNFGISEGFDKNASVLNIDGPVPLTVIGIMALDDFEHTSFDNAIKSAKSSGRAVIIFPHWGTEYATTHNTAQEQMAREWISAGADAVIGSHPHVVEDVQIISGKPVVYSLGNFVFDQYFSQNTQRGLVIAGSITKDKIKLTFLPTEEKNIKPQFSTGANKKQSLDSLFSHIDPTGAVKVDGDTMEISR